MKRQAGMGLAVMKMKCPGNYEMEWNDKASLGQVTRLIYTATDTSTTRL